MSVPIASTAEFRFPHRVSGLRDALLGVEPAPLPAILVSHLENVRYLTGFSGSNGIVLVTSGEAIFITDGRYDLQSSREVPGFSRVIAPQGTTLQQAAAEQVHRLGLQSVGFEKAHLTVAQFEALRKAIDGDEEQGSPGKGVQLSGHSNLVEGLRSIKDATEAAAIRRSMRLADACFAHVRETVRLGMTERELAWEIEVFLRRGGAQRLAFDPIVGSGLNSALIHGRPSDRRLGESGGPEFLLLDFGAELDGYCSDITRTVVIGGDPTPRHVEIYEAVLACQRAALTAIKPGVPGKEIDKTARQAVKAAGMPEFNHGLGHGLGRVVHDGPALSQLSEVTLAAGMVTTVEPGVYIEGFGGVRIEDVVLVTKDGCENLTRSPKDLLVLG